MKNKKVLNILILLLSLVTFVTDILLFAFPAYEADASKFLVVVFWILNSIALISMIATILITLISLFMDDYVASKTIETFALVTFVMTLITVITFAMSHDTLSFGYVLVCLFAFLTANISQIARLVASFPTWKGNLSSLVKTHKDITIIDGTKHEEPSKEDSVEEETK